MKRNKSIWDKYYTKEEKNYKFPDISMYDLLKKNNYHREKKIALNYFNNKVTFSYFFNEIDKVAKAIARKYNWTIVPSGNTALNLLGLSTQVPATWSYISDGRYANFRIGNITIEFKHRTNGDISKMSTKTAMVIQAIKAIGKDNVTEKEINFLKRKMPQQEKEELLSNARSTSVWVYYTIMKICEVEHV